MPIKDSLDNQQLRRVWPFGCLKNEPENKTLVAALRQGAEARRNGRDIGTPGFGNWRPG